MSSAPFPCVRCGARRVTLREGAGRTYAYRVFSALAIPAHVPIPTCGLCLATYIDEHTALALEAVLAAEYRKELSRKARQAIADLSVSLSQRKLELRLDLAQGYLSRIFHGHGAPSAPLVVLLALLAQDPTLLEWVARYWKEPTSPK